jgi:lipopolysaccharide exporter
MNDLRNKMAKGALWMLLFKFLDRSVGLISTLVLVRLLSPSSFGVMAMATSLIAILELIGAFGFDNALIQRDRADRRHFDTAWTFNVLFGVIICLILQLLAYPAARFYRLPELASVIQILAFSPLLMGAQNIGVVAFRKELDFRREFMFLTSKRLLTFPLTIGLAFLWRSYWALVLGTIAGRLLELHLSYRLHPYRPRLSLQAAADLFQFSKWVFALNTLTLLRDRSADFVIGRVLGAHSLGLFSVSYEISRMPGTELVAPINRAVYPAYARLASDLDKLRQEYVSVMAMICLLAVPAVAGVAALAQLIVPIVLGVKWLAVVPVLQYLSFFGILQVMQSNASVMFMALGRGDVFTRLTAVYVVLLIATLALMVQKYGLQGAALSYLVVALVMLPITVTAILRTIHLRFSTYLREVWRPLAAATAMFLIVKSQADRVVTTGSTGRLLGVALALVVLGAVVYVAVIYVTWWISGKPAESAEAVAFRKVRSRVPGLR